MIILNQTQAVNIADMAVIELAKYIRENKLQNIILGISGGLDSAVMAAIGLKAISLLKSWGYSCGYKYVFIDVDSKPVDLVKARALASKIGFYMEEVNLTEWYFACPFRIQNPVTHLDRLRNGNIKCRERMVYLFHLASEERGLVLDTDDLSELLMGFWTINGDVGNVKVIQELTKDEVRDLGEFLGVPKIILESAPGDGLGVTATNIASDQLGMIYLKIDYTMSQLIRYGFDINGSDQQLTNQGFKLLFERIAAEIQEPVEKLVHVAWQSVNTGFKRKYGDNVKILLPSRKAMGLPELGSDQFSKVYLTAIQKEF